MKKYDAIIIGAGLGGLTAGAKLAKEGNKVLLLEQHYIPGGCATVFKRKDFVMEVGLHELDGLDDEDPKTEIFQDLGVDNNIEFIKLPEFYRFTNKRVDIVIPDNTEEAICVLTEKYPEEKKGIVRFFRVLGAIRKEINRMPSKRWKLAIQFPFFPVLYPHLVFNTFKNLGDFLDSTINNEDLKLILQANIAYYHDDPYTMSLIYFSAGNSGYYRGGYYIKGGSQNLSNYLAQVIRDNEGTVELNHLVTKIITKDDKAIGVEYTKKTGKDSAMKSAFAEIIIANAAVPNIVNMLDTKNGSRLKNKISHLKTACSITSIYIGFKKALKDLGNQHYSTFFVDESVKNTGDFFRHFKVDYRKRNFILVDYSQIDSGLAPVGKGFGVVCTLDYLSDWKNLEPNEYKDKKELVAKIFVERLENIIPGITNEIEHCEVATPKTIQRYTLNPEGTAYGFAQIPKQTGLFRLPNKSPVKNLYFASAWTMPGHGFTGVILSGWLCAKEVNHVLKRLKST